MQKSQKRNYAINYTSLRPYGPISAQFHIREMRSTTRPVYMVSDRSEIRNKSIHGRIYGRAHYAPRIYGRRPRKIGAWKLKARFPMSLPSGFHFSYWVNSINNSRVMSVWNSVMMSAFTFYAPTVSISA